MIRQSIDAPLALGSDVGPGLRWSEIRGFARGRKKRMAKIIVVEKSMYIGAQHATRGVHRTVWNVSGNSLARDICERPRSRLINSFTHMYLIAREALFWAAANAEEFGAHVTLDPPHGFLNMK
jgi:hypothetical protein